jgi:hypothetical protein
MHLLLDSVPVRPSLRLPDDFIQHFNQSINVFCAVLDAQAHTGEARQRDLRE